MGTCPESIECSKIVVSGVHRTSDSSLRTLGEILSGPAALFGLRDERSLFYTVDAYFCRRDIRIGCVFFARDVFAGLFGEY